MDYESPELYAVNQLTGAVATTATPNNLVLTLSGTHINLTDNGVLVDTELFSSTSEININGADNASDTLTINFSGGNMVPAGGLNFDGIAYDSLSSLDTAEQGATSLILTGTLPTGVWTNEVDRPLGGGGTSGLIRIRASSRSEGSRSSATRISALTPGATMAGQAGYVPYPILDQTPANDASFIALGSNTDTLGLSQINIGGVQYTQLTSGTTIPGPNGTTIAAPLFLPEVFINKTDITIADADGNDTLKINYNAGNPVPAAGLTFNGGTGLNTVTVTGQTNVGSTYLLSASGISDTTLGGGALNLQNVQNFTLTGGSKNDTFDITGWTGSGTIVGGGGSDTVDIQKSVSMGVNGNYIGAADGMLMTESGIAATVLQGHGDRQHYLHRQRLEQQRRHIVVERFCRQQRLQYWHGADRESRQDSANRLHQCPRRGQRDSHSTTARARTSPTIRSLPPVPARSSRWRRVDHGPGSSAASRSNRASCRARCSTPTMPTRRAAPSR